MRIKNLSKIVAVLMLPVMLLATGHSAADGGENWKFSCTMRLVVQMSKSVCCFLSPPDWLTDQVFDKSVMVDFEDIQLKKNKHGMYFFELAKEVEFAPSESYSAAFGVHLPIVVGEKGEAVLLQSPRLKGLTVGGSSFNLKVDKVAFSKGHKNDDGSYETDEYSSEEDARPVLGKALAKCLGFRTRVGNAALQVTNWRLEKVAAEDASME